MRDVMLAVFGLLALKSMLVGSEFSFYKWVKYGRRYTTWYFNRSDFDPEAKP